MSKLRDALGFLRSVLVILTVPAHTRLEQKTRKADVVYYWCRLTGQRQRWVK